MKTLLKRDIETKYSYLTFKSVLNYYKFEYEIYETHIICNKDEFRLILFKNDKNQIVCFKPISNKFLLAYEIPLIFEKYISTDEISIMLEYISVEEEFSIGTIIKSEMIFSIAYSMYEINENNLIINRDLIKNTPLAEAFYCTNEDTLSIPLFDNNNIVNILDFNFNNFNLRYPDKRGSYYKPEEEVKNNLKVFVNPSDYLKLIDDGNFKDSAPYIINYNCNLNDYNHLMNTFNDNGFSNMTIISNSHINSMMFNLNFIKNYINTIIDGLFLNMNILDNKAQIIFIYNSNQYKNLTFSKMFNDLSIQYRKDYSINHEINDDFMVHPQFDYKFQLTKNKNKINNFQVEIHLKPYFVHSFLNSLLKTFDIKSISYEILD